MIQHQQSSATVRFSSKRVEIVRRHRERDREGSYIEVKEAVKNKKNYQTSTLLIPAAVGQPRTPHQSLFAVAFGPTSFVEQAFLPSNKLSFEQAFPRVAARSISNKT
jgi:hypothetical protein